MYAIDGDTFVINHEHVRIVGINAPEIHHAACERELAQGYQAKVFLQRWLDDRKPIIVRMGLDKYGRTLAELIPSPNEDMIRSGLAELYLCLNGKCPKHRNWCEVKMLSH